MIFYIWKLLYNIIRRLYNYIKIKFFTTKTNTITLEPSNGIHYELFNMIPQTDTDARQHIEFIINKRLSCYLICNNPKCTKKLVNEIYCIFDSYYCSMECQNIAYRLFFIYWEKLQNRYINN
jgi:hypothetical protein